MEYILYCLFITVFIILGLNIIYRRKYNKQIQYAIQKETEKYIEKNKQHLEFLAKRDIEYLLKQRDEVEADLKQKIDYLHSVQDTYAKLNAQIEEQQERAKNYEADQRARTDKIIATYEEDKRTMADAKIKAEAEEKQKAAELAFAQTMADMAQRSEAAGALIEQMGKQIEQLKEEINDYTAKQAAINEAIMRQRAIDEQQDFYRVCLAPETANDVSVLNIARQNLKKPEIIDKIIYDNYISKPVLEMVKRVLQNTTCSGIYKITCLKTGEIYIGKSTDIKSRWQQHCKSAFNCGTIAHSLLHTKMKQHGIEQFTFEVVEQVPKDQLSEREKFYINFYQTKETGLNERNG